MTFRAIYETDETRVVEIKIKIGTEWSTESFVHLKMEMPKDEKSRDTESCFYKALMIARGGLEKEQLRIQGAAV